MLMSKSQAAEVAAALRKASKDHRSALVRISYQPRHGYVVELVRNGKALHTWETGVQPLPSLLDSEVSE